MNVHPSCGICFLTPKNIVPFTAPFPLRFTKNHEESEEECHINTYWDCFKYCTKINFGLDSLFSPFVCEQCSKEIRTTFKFLQKVRIVEKCLKEVSKVQIIKCEPSVESYQEERIQETKPMTSPVIGETVQMQSEEVETFFIGNDDTMDDNSEFLIFHQPHHINQTSSHFVERDESTSFVTENEDGSTSLFNESGEDQVNNNEFITIEKLDTLEGSDPDFIELSEELDEGERVTTSPDEGSTQIYFGCHYCLQRFMNEDDLLSHIKNEHQIIEATNHETTIMPSQIYTCTTCSKTFNNQKALAGHNRIHSTKKLDPNTITDVCNICSKSFNNNRAFRNHLRWHRPDKHTFYVCDICSKRSLNKYSMKRHMELHNKDLKCNECDMSFVEVSSFQNHLESHKDDSIVNQVVV